MNQNSAYINKNSIFKADGFSLIQVMMTMTIASIVSLGIIHLMTQMENFRVKETHLNRLEEIKRNLVSIIRDDSSWEETIKQEINEEMVCLKKGTDCKSVVDREPAPLIKHLVDASGNLVMDSNDQLQNVGGLTFDGHLCKGFDDIEGNDDCPLRYEIRWKPICAKNQPCLHSSLRITGQLLYVPKTKTSELKFNKGRLGFEVIRPPGSSDQLAQLACLTENGTWGEGGCQTKGNSANSNKKEELSKDAPCPSQSFNFKNHTIDLPESPSGQVHMGQPIMNEESVILTGTYKCESGQWNTITAPSEMSLGDMGKILKEGFGSIQF